MVTAAPTPDPGKPKLKSRGWKLLIYLLSSLAVGRGRSWSWKTPGCRGQQLTTDSQGEVMYGDRGEQETPHTLSVWGLYSFLASGRLWFPPISLVPVCLAVRSLSLRSEVRHCLPRSECSCLSVWFLSSCTFLATALVRAFVTTQLLILFPRNSICGLFIPWA